MNPTATEPGVPELLESTMRSHASGDLAAAAQGYERLRELAPLNPDTWHFGGLFEVQREAVELGERYIRRAIELDPGRAIFHNNLGNVLSRSDRVAEAEAAYRQAIAIDAKCFDARSNLGLLARRRGQFEEAEKVYLELLGVAPGHTNARQNIVSLYMRMGRLKEAVVHAVTGLMTAPRNSLLRRILGRIYAEDGAPEKAIELYRKWLEDDPDHPEPQHHLAALLGQGVPERASDPYVRSTFAGFAESFDAKLAQLEYRAPKLIGDSIAEVLGVPARSLRVTDAGCGTGLCAQYLLPYASELVGVDLTQEMLDRARVRGGYGELVLGELVAFLESRPQSCDLLVSADTLCYFGSLRAFAAAARGSLAAGGWVAFTLEAHDDAPDAPDYKLHVHGRYSHRRSYVEAVMRAAGFGDLAIGDVVLRNEGEAPVRGWLTRARVPTQAATQA